MELPVAHVTAISVKPKMNSFKRFSSDGAKVLLFREICKKLSWENSWENDFLK